MIEVYAMVVFRERQPMNSMTERYLAELRAEARYQEEIGEGGLAKIYRHDVRTLVKEATETTYHFCRIRLVQPEQKGKRVPVPRWGVVEDHISIPSSWQDRMADWSDFWEVVVVEPRLSIPYFKFLDSLYDRRVTLAQIRFLYPETKTMPLAFALDYVRDRL